MSRNPQQSNPFRPLDARDPFGSPTPSVVHTGQPSESDMDYYDRRETFQSEASGVGNTHDYEQPFDPYGELFSTLFRRVLTAPRLVLRSPPPGHRHTAGGGPLRPTP